MFSETEKLRNPDIPYNEKDSVVIAVDLGCEFTKVSYWNFEDGCSSIVKINGLESFPTAISYRVIGLIPIYYRVVMNL